MPMNMTINTVIVFLYAGANCTGLQRTFAGVSNKQGGPLEVRCSL